MVEKIHDDWKSEFQTMRYHTGRHWMDCIMVLIYVEYAQRFIKSKLIKGPKHIKFNIITNNASSNQNVFRNIQKNKYKFFVLNDSYSKTEIGQSMEEFLRSQFPEKSSFEM